MNHQKSEAILTAAREVIPGGVNSPVRAYRAVGGTPPHLVRGDGAHVWDEDGNEYIDLVLSYGPLILGHGHTEVKQALHTAVDAGTAFGAPTRGELDLARQILARVPSIEMVRLVNSGTEATMSALRLARAATGRELMVKFEGCYHGHGDSFLVQAGSGALTFGAPDSPGVPAAVANQTLVAPYNDLEATRALFDAHGADIACVFLEPVAGNMGTVHPVEGFLEGLRALCDQHGALLVFDEVMTGFRVAKGGYQDRTDVRADLTTLGKVIGGGLPIGAYGGRRDLMERVSPAGDVYQAGTLSGNPLAVAAGAKTLEVLGRSGAYTQLEKAGATLEEGLRAAFTEFGVPVTVPRCGSMLCVYLGADPVHRLADVGRTDTELWVRFFHGMLERGVLLPPSPYEAWFLSTAHDANVLGRIVEAARATLKDLTR
jgi:glutamate-1-semialdehyde 2,1-aminomutase